VLNVGWLAPGDQWDTSLVADLLSGALYPHGIETRNWQGYPRGRGAIIVCPSRYWAGHEVAISEALSVYEWVLMFVTSDEEATFACSNVLHDNIKWIIQTPREGRKYPEGARFIGVGYTPHFRDLPPDPPEKVLDVVLAAQRTHKRRQQAFEAAAHIQGTNLVHETPGFTQGLPVADYVSAMLKAKVAPCPSGAVSPDSFRAYEALEAHCIPVVDAVSPVDGKTDYWSRVLPGAPFPVIEDWSDLPGWVEDLLKDWPANANRVTAWWQRQKRQYVKDLVADLRGLGAL
jgi:hypothetical protein